MQSAMSRSTLRLLPRTTRAAQTSNHTARRSFASEVPGDVKKQDTSRSVDPNPAGKNTFVYVAGGIIFFLVAGRYFIASSKTPGSGHAEQQQARRSGEASKEFRDPRDSAVKTLGQKKEKEEAQAS